MGLVEIVNPNGRKGRVAETSAAARAYPQPPSARAATEEREDVPGDPAATPASAQTAPAKNASAEDWRAYAVAVHDVPPADLAELSRDQLVELYADPTSTPEKKD